MMSLAPFHISCDVYQSPLCIPSVLPVPSKQRSEVMPAEVSSLPTGPEAALLLLPGSVVAGRPGEEGPFNSD